MSSALKAFEKDSQEGTILARQENPKRFSAEERSSYLETLQRVPAFSDPDLILSDAFRGR